MLWRTFKPVECQRIAAPREDVEHWRCEVDAPHFGLALRAQHHARVPESRRASRRGAARAAGALIGGVERDLFGDEMIDRGLGVEAQHFLQAGVDHVGDAFDGERRFGDVGGEDDFSFA